MICLFLLGRPFSLFFLLFFLCGVEASYFDRSGRSGRRKNGQIKNPLPFVSFQRLRRCHWPSLLAEGYQIEDNRQHFASTSSARLGWAPVEPLDGRERGDTARLPPLECVLSNPEIALCLKNSASTTPLTGITVWLVYRAWPNAAAQKISVAGLSSVFAA